MKIEIVKDEWYQKLLFDLKLLAFEKIVEIKHSIGKRILKDELKFKRAKYGDKTIEGLAKDLDIHASDLWACMKFAKKYPELSHDMREFSWYYIRNKLLSEHPHVAQSTGENEWYTPKKYIEAAKDVMGDIDVDPASSEIANQTVGAKIYYTIQNDGLTKSWAGRVWMNPPYSQPLIVRFSETFVKKYKDGEIKEGCVLVNNATDTVWLQMMLEICNKICFIKGRIRFIDIKGEATGAPLQGQLILYFGKNIQKFNRKFSKFGIVK